MYAYNTLITSITSSCMNEENEIVELTLKGGGLDFTCKTTLPKAAQIIGFVSTEEVISARSITTEPITLPAETKAGTIFSSPIEAVRQSGARSYPQKIAALGYFLTKRNGTETFDQKEIMVLLRRMGDAPRNFTRDLNNAELLGYVNKETNGEYFLTEIAKEEVASQFSSAIPAVNNSKKRKPRKKTDNTPTAEA